MFLELYLLFCPSEEIHSGDLNDGTAMAGTKIVKLAQRPLGPRKSPGRNQAEKATLLQTWPFLIEKEESQRQWAQELARAVNQEPLPGKRTSL